MAKLLKKGTEKMGARLFNGYFKVYVFYRNAYRKGFLLKIPWYI